MKGIITNHQMTTEMTTVKRTVTIAGQQYAIGGQSFSEVLGKAHRIAYINGNSLDQIDLRKVNNYATTH